MGCEIIPSPDSNLQVKGLKNTFGSTKKSEVISIDHDFIILFKIFYRSEKLVKILTRGSDFLYAVKRRYEKILPQRGEIEGIVREYLEIVVLRNSQFTSLKIITIWATGNEVITRNRKYEQVSICLSEIQQIALWPFAASAQPYHNFFITSLHSITEILQNNVKTVKVFQLFTYLSFDNQMENRSHL